MADNTSEPKKWTHQHQYVHLRDYYNFIKDKSCDNAPTTFYHFSVTFFDHYNFDSASKNDSTVFQNLNANKGFNTVIKLNRF